MNGENYPEDAYFEEEPSSKSSTLKPLDSATVSKYPNRDISNILWITEDPRQNSYTTEDIVYEDFKSNTEKSELHHDYTLESVFPYSQDS